MRKAKGQWRYKGIGMTKVEKACVDKINELIDDHNEREA